MSNVTLHPPPKPSLKRLWDQLFQGLGIVCILLTIGVLITLLLDVFRTGFYRISWDFITGHASRKAELAGLLPALVGTTWMMLLTGVLAVPTGIAAAIYLEEYGNNNRFASFLEINISNLAGVPSVIYGILGLQIFVRLMQLGASFLAAALTLSLLILPTIIVTTREALRAVPSTIREASYALGASRWQTIFHQVLPQAAGGILTGIILALSRAIGETAPLIVLGAKVFVSLPHSLSDPYTVLPLQLYNWISRPEKAFAVNASATIILLLLITFAMNAVAIYLRNRWQTKRL